MIRKLPWIILGGVLLVAGVVVAQLFGTYLFLQSPEKVVTGAFSRFLDTKSFLLDVSAEQPAKNGFSLNVKGMIDKQSLSRPVADLSFSFQTAEQSFYGNGEARARDGKFYIRFDQVVGLPGILPGALQSIWAGLDIDALIAVGKESIFPQATGNMTEADLVALKEITKKNIPIKVIGKGIPAFIDNVGVVAYKVELDRVKLEDLILEVQTAVNGGELSAEKRKEVIKKVVATPKSTGEVWIGKSDGRLLAMTFIVGTGETAVHGNIKISRYGMPVAVDTPVESRPLIDLYRRITGNTLSGVTLKLPFEIPVPILQLESKIPNTTLPVGGAGPSKDLGGLPNLLKLFYGTDKPFGS